MIESYHGYIYRNESIDEENLDMRVSVIAIGQGSCNLLELYDTGKLVWLACIDFGTSSGEGYIQIYKDNNSPGNILEEKMKLRVRDGGLAAEYYAYMDMFLLTHQDEDHQNKLKTLIRSLNGKAPLNKKKYIGAMYLGGFDYMKTISVQLAADGVIGKAVENMYHITSDNKATCYTRFGKKDVPANGKARVTLNWILSCLIGNQQFDSPGTFPTPDIKKSPERPGDPVNFHNGTKTATAHTKNESSTLLLLQIYFPSRTTNNTVSFIFPGDAEVTTFEKYNALTNKPEIGIPLLFLMPHHGSQETAHRSGNMDQLNEFVRSLTRGGKSWCTVASSAVAGASGSGALGHPASGIVAGFSAYTADAVVVNPDNYQNCCVVSQHTFPHNNTVETKVQAKTVCTTEFVVSTDKPKPRLMNLDYNKKSTGTKFKLMRRNFKIKVTFADNKITYDDWYTEEMSTPVLVP